MNTALLNRVFRALVFTAWAQKVVQCEHYGEQVGDGRHDHNEEHHEDHNVQPLYKFGYWVHDPKTNDVKNHWEHRDGDVVHGSYSLMQPDGHVRIVDYTVDKHTGFNAHVKYVYEGHGGDGGGGTAEGFSNGGGGGYGADFNSHLQEDDVSAAGQSQIGGGGHSKSLSKLYKKVRPEKPGQYKRPHHIDTGKPNPVSGGGNEFKKQRLPPAAEYSAERYSKPIGHFDQLSKFPSNHNPFGYPGEDLGATADRPSSDLFARKYSASQSSADKSSYYTGIKHQSAERGLTYHRPDVVVTASTEHRQSSEEPQQPALQRPAPQQPAPQRLQLSRVQRSHIDEDGHVEPIDDLVDDRIEPQSDTFARMQKQQFREYGFDEPPYPFEIPEKLSSMAGKYQKRHSHQPAAVSSSSSYFPSGSTASDNYDDHEFY